MTLSPLQDQFIMSMNKVKVTVEGMFGQIATYFAFLDYKKNLENSTKCCWEDVHCMCASANAHTCLYKNEVATF